MAIQYFPGAESPSTVVFAWKSIREASGSQQNGSLQDHKVITTIYSQIPDNQCL
jgi:hypothetical protein